MANMMEAESVWDYPRPPKVEPTTRHLRIIHRGIVLADTINGFRVLEKSHPPVYYIPKSDISMELLSPSSRRSSFCEFKGSATYWNVDLASALKSDVAASRSSDAAWSYQSPSVAFAQIRDHLAFYASRVDECTVDGGRVIPQVGDFYGGWITSDLKGPFKGAPGTLGW